MCSNPFCLGDTWCVDWNCGSMASEKLLGIEIALLRHYRHLLRREFAFRCIACAFLTNPVMRRDYMTFDLSIAHAWES